MKNIRLFVRTLMRNTKNIVSKFLNNIKKGRFYVLSSVGLLLFIFLEATYLFFPTFKIKGAHNLEKCKSLNDSSLKIQCGEEVIDNILQTNGVDDALETMAQISEMDKEFVNSCHGFAHEIGEHAYKLFKKKKDFKVSPKITYCSYGFYHGFMETMLQDSGDYQKARDFCSFINNQLLQQGLDLAGECYHGIGHGTIDQHDPKQWTKPALAIKESMELCHKLATDDKYLVDCASGVFNGIANFYSAGQYGLKINEQDPFWLCDLQEETVKKTCYAFMARTLFSLTGSGLSKAIDLATKTAPANYLGTVISNLTVLNPNEDTASWEDIVDLCRSVPQTVIKECLRGYAIGLLQSGQPGKEYQAPISFCKSELLTLEEKQLCFENILIQLKNYYPKAQLEQICQSVDNSYRHLCI